MQEIPDAIAGRWGGEEFMIFIKEYRDDAVKEMAKELLYQAKNSGKDRVCSDLDQLNQLFLPKKRYYINPDFIVINSIIGKGTL